MNKLLTAVMLVISLLGTAASPAIACNGTVHLPHCGASGNFC